MKKQVKAIHVVPSKPEKKVEKKIVKEVEVKKDKPIVKKPEVKVEAKKVPAKKVAETKGFTKAPVKSKRPDEIKQDQLSKMTSTVQKQMASAFSSNTISSPAVFGESEAPQPLLKVTGPKPTAPKGAVSMDQIRQAISNSAGVSAFIPEFLKKK
jgi:hypothetical protein